MKSRFSRLICWCVFLFCLACNARADTPSSDARQRSERITTPPGKAQGNENKPVVIDNERIRGRHEYEVQAPSGSELRGAPVNSAGQPQDGGGRSQPRQNYTPSTAAKPGEAATGHKVEAGNKEDQRGLTEAEGIAGPHAVQEFEPQLRPGATSPAGIASPGLKDRTKMATPGGVPETGGGKPGFAEAEHIRGHLEQPGDMKLRLGGGVEPETEVKVAAPVAEKVSPKSRPVFVAADRLQGHSGKEVEAIGRAELNNGDQLISADRLKYRQDTEDAEAEGGVRVEQRGDILEGSRLKFNLASKTGELSQPSYQLKDASSRGYADMLLFEGENHYRFRQANYTTCPAGDDDWHLNVGDLQLDHSKRVGTARNVKLTFKDVPILYTPWMNFSYSGQRKSGLLAPVYGTNVRTGLEVTVPFYWNIAPNYDATISARMMSKRGVSLNNEFRYLGEKFSGTILGDILPNDWDTQTTRWRTSFAHDHNLGRGFSARLDYNRVSDDAYFRDLGNNLNLTSRTNLLQQGLLSYNRGLGDDGTLNVTSMVQSFQTIQDPLASIVAPYKRLPQIAMVANKPDIFGMDLNFIGSWSNFSHPTLVSGHRVVLFPSVSYPMRNAFGYVTPKIGIHHTRYNLDATGTSPEASPDRTLPILSLDSGIAFDRQMSLGGERFTQTLEPRLFYVYVPFRDQSQLPNFDSAKTDFSFAQMLNENRFSGHDRINDANQLTFALTSRLIESGTGKERLRLAVGQQISFIDRRVTLDAPETINRRPDFVAAVTGFLTPTISTDSSVQFDQTRFVADVVRSGLSYRPEPGRVVNVGYRFTRDVLHQVDASSQWRWSERWQTVARLNYSLQDQKILEGLAGLEYNACCWSLRFVLQHLTTATQKTTTAAFLQLELNGLMQIGSNPLQVLQRSIPGYLRTGSQGSSPLEGP
ncbi:MULTISPECIES: LPS-assembly protein LptD [unclassified Nitrosospira]|uniref:LPS-assembly protein LptD n=1 Tax=unclassified Nitrosospira TaxID=2609267 RepID=UPI000D31A658|nr:MULTISPECIES: LPS-assembly protein LptD [unclassified Nitrosospira]PTR15726.1 LPS-assembly protein [Nitrosospira sp. Nsp2]WON74853.1 LPS-assembly protein LptD [Nitrosospira sp. Is2]